MRNRSLFDRFLAVFAPGVALNREKKRLLLENFGDFVASRRFEGASKGRRMAGWNTPGTDANSALLNNLPVLRNRARDLVRNSGWAAKGISVLVENVVGTGIIGKPVSKSAPKAKRAKELWKLWADSTACDFEGLHDFAGLQALVMRAVAESGECLIRRIRIVSEDNVPLQIQVLESDYLDHTKNEKIEGGGFIVQGVEFDRAGKKVAFWIFMKHPGDVNAGSTKSVRMPAEDFSHIYAVQRPSQVRGVPVLAPVILSLRDFTDYVDAELVRARTQACFSVFVSDTEPPIDAVGNGSQLPIDKIEPGLIEYLPPGKQIQLASPPVVNALDTFASQTLHQVAAGMQIPFESLTGDYSRVNFSSGRMGWIEFQRNIDGWRWRVLVPRLCDVVWKWFIEAAFLAGANLEGVSVSWTAPRREMIDPTSEINSTLSAVRGGLMTISEAIRQSGYDPDEVMAERALDDARLDEMGIQLDSDPRKTMKAGMTQPDVTVEKSAELKAKADALAGANEGNA